MLVQIKHHETRYNSHLESISTCSIFTRVEMLEAELTNCHSFAKLPAANAVRSMVSFRSAWSLTIIYFKTITVDYVSPVNVSTEFPNGSVNNVHLESPRTMELYVFVGTSPYIFTLLLHREGILASRDFQRTSNSSNEKQEEKFVATAQLGDDQSRLQLIGWYRESRTLLTLKVEVD